MINSIDKGKVQCCEFKNYVLTDLETNDSKGLELEASEKGLESLEFQKYVMCTSETVSF